MEANGDRALIVLQAPGVDEWRDRRPAISGGVRSAAARLRNSMRRIGRTRSDYSITNAVQCYPGRLASGRDRKPSMAARRACIAWLRNDITMRAWRRILVFGQVAKSSVQEIMNDPCPDNVIFLKHPCGGLRNEDLDAAM